ncbi:MAG: hypothetical protein K2Y23_11120 [Cyanobacteria bacterium]|nr:hypothetical protein [Cyanobacteriota bacterium]
MISHDREEIEFTALYEQRLGKRSMYEIGVPVTNSGVHEVEIAVKHALFSSNTSIFSLGFETALSQVTTMFEPFISAGTMLRDWYVQTQIKYGIPADRTKADRTFVYNTYVGRDTSQAPDTWTIGVELNGENHVVAVTPQVRKGLTGTGALAASIGATVPIYGPWRQTGKFDRPEKEGVKWVGYLLWEYLEPLRARK